MGKLADQNRFWSAICQNWSENGRWPIVISSPAVICFNFVILYAIITLHKNFAKV